VSIHQKRKSKLVLIVHKESLLLRLRRNGYDRRSSSGDFAGSRRHGFHLCHAKRTPAPANEQKNKPTSSKKLGRRDDLAIMIRQFKRRRFPAGAKHAKCIGGESLSFEASNRTQVDSLNCSGNVFGDSFFALSKNFAQRANISTRVGFLQRAPFHKRDPAALPGSATCE